MRYSGRALCVLACGVAAAACGDPGYSFGRYDERIGDVAPIADRYCDKAAECAPRAFGPDADFCRFSLIGFALQLEGDCEEALRAVVECAEHSSCLEFPILFERFPGGCLREVDAFKTCDEPTSATEGRGP